MFFPMTPEMINNIIESNKIESNKIKPPLTFEAYNKKRFHEECKYISDNPSFRMNYIEVTTKLLNIIREISLKEYNRFWPTTLFSHTNELDTESVISEYDILDEGECVDVDDTDECVDVDDVEDDVEDECVVEIPVRRSNRLKGKCI